MTSASSLSTHVADHTRHRKPIGYHFCVGARAGGRAPRVNCGPMYQNLTEILPAPIFRSAAPTPPGSGRLRTAFERTRYPIARAVRIFSLGEGLRRLILNSSSFIHALKQAFGCFPKRLKPRGA